MPLSNRNAPLTGRRKRHFEDLRKHHVPRYLFRTWSSTSGGGSKISINSETEIVPPAFVKGAGHKFYEMDEDYIERMARNHYSGLHEPLTEFSSWTASLHFAFIYAEWMYGEARRDVHVAIIDTKQLDGEVLAWHCPHIMKTTGNHEFLVHGRISGKGYRAVKYKDILAAGLKRIVPELTKPFIWSDSTPRTNIFLDPAKTVTDHEMESVQAVSALFGDLSFPVAVACLTLRPRPGLKRKRRYLGFSASIELTSNEMNVIMRGLSYPEIPDDLACERWLFPGMVDTRQFQDVRQWIAMLGALAKYKKRKFFQRPSGKHDSLLSQQPA
ncbi:hypothetical protein BDV96DRAFT_648983 [Lophiotrema nucula]|uniref:DUF7587 domain-containing protein n=1 Tax=Lophiotrema nucula TaxID=690887 RepID=A0A6A5Z013_9PLEO|nr:hypothetical protein BDV96DRAFT_648983 [Lophiotrema nucula]